jgi:hypothetical protein
MIRVIWRQSSKEKVRGILKSHMQESIFCVAGSSGLFFIYSQLSKELVKPCGSLQPNHLMSTPLLPQLSKKSVI